MANLLLYNIGPEKMKKLSVLLLRSGIRWRIVKSEDYSLPLSDLLKGTISGQAAARAETEQAFQEEMLIMNDFSSSQLNSFLYVLRQNKINIPLKAVVTETNANWSSETLYRELSAERKAMEAGQPAHPQKEKK